MKTNILSRKNRHLANLTFALLLGGLGLTAQAQNSPVGTWDCSYSHARRGTAYITFGDDFTINGILILTPVPSGTNNFTTSERTNAFGAHTITNGVWHFGTTANASRAPVVGFYTANFYVGNELVVTPVSFSATVTPGKKIIITSTVDGRIVFLKGVPATPLPDISGSYYGKGRNEGVLFNEFFTLKRSSQDYLNNNPNAYDLEVQGAGYSLSGFALLSKQRISLYSIGETNQIG